MSTPSAKRPSNSDLPADVILEILLRLPVKPLMRFKCVCKHWYALIGSQSFVNQHFSHESNQEHLLVRNYIPNEELPTFSLFVDDICFGYVEPDYLQMPDTVDDLLGPVNGVFCVVGKSRNMALLNPAMRQFKPLPSLEMEVQPHVVFVDDVLGLGLDPLSGDYKIVSVQIFWNKDMEVLHDPLVYIYNSGSDSWRQIEDAGSFNSNYSACRSLCNTYFGGIYYWLLEFHNNNVAAILAFDMTSEKFEEIQVPDSVTSRVGHLTLYGDLVALLSYDSEKIDKCDIWVMNTGEGWTKSFTVGPFQDISWPLCFWKKDELLLEAESSFLTRYNIHTKKLQTIEARVRENTTFLSWVFSYKESLVSIKREGDNCKLWDASSSCKLWDASSYFIKYYLDE